MKKKQNSAYLRGSKAATRLKKLGKATKKLEAKSADWARAHHMPVWLGKLPAKTLSLTLFVAFILLALTLAAAYMAGTALVVLLKNMPDDVLSQEEKRNGYRDGPLGYGLYSGNTRLDLDED